MEFIDFVQTNIDEARLGDVSNKGRKIQHIAPNPETRYGHKWLDDGSSKAVGDIAPDDQSVRDKLRREMVKDFINSPKGKRLTGTDTFIDKIIALVLNKKEL